MKHKRLKKSLMFLLAIAMCITASLSVIPVVNAAGGGSDLLSGWTVEDGYSVTSIWVYEGSYALQHTGAQSNAVSTEFDLENGVTYYVSAFVRCADENASVKVNVGGFDLESETHGQWEELSVKLSGKGQKDKITITANGDAYIDGVSIRPFKEGDEMLNGNNAFGGVTKADDIGGRSGVISGMQSGITAGHPSVSVEPNSFYMYSADFYIEGTPPWMYADMNDAEGEVQIRGTKEGEWHTVAGIWSSGSNTSTAIRIVKEGNWDDPVHGVGVTGSAYIDNVSFKKVSLYDDLISGSFEEDNTWELRSGASISDGTHMLHGRKSLKLEDNATAVANGGQTIKVEPNTYYYMSAWRLRPGDKTVSGNIVIRSADESQILYSITGSRYFQTMWNPADGGNMAERKTGHWEQIFGFWNSGNNTQVKLTAESAGTGLIYFDDVTFNAYENRTTLGNIFSDGDMEGFIPDAQDLYPTDAEKTRVREQYAGFLAEDLKNFPASFKVGDTSYKGFGTDFTKVSQNDTAVDGGTKTTTVLTHTPSGLKFTVESVLYPAYNAYDWTIWVENTGSSNSPVVSQFNAVDLNYDGEAPKLKGSRGDVAAYQPYIEQVEGKKVTKKPTGGKGTQDDSSYFNFMYGDKGVLYAVGWPGQWTMSVDNTGGDNVTRLTAGQENFKTYLAPGEKVRTPLMAFVNYNGRNLERATNLWRRWMIDCNMHKITDDASGQGEAKLPAPAIFAATSIQWHEMTRATDENQIAAIQYYLDNDIDLTFWWMDAGWYYKVNAAGQFETLDDWGWSATGTWVVDDQRFPSKMKAISDFAGEHGIKTLLWFEPERVSGSLRTDGLTIHPDWVLDGYLVDMGRPEAVQWTLDRILKVIGEGGISMYREDFNCYPLSAWTHGDQAKDPGGNRVGITENLHIQGHLRLWDTILETYPNATIDVCASGGMRNDLESMRRGLPLHKTDHAYGDRTWQQDVTTDMQRWIPYIGTKTNGESAADNNTTTANRYSLRTGMVGGMVLGYNTEESVPLDWDIVKDITEEHKDLAKYLYSDYYVLEDWSSSESDWAAWQYYDIEMGGGYAIAFRRANATGTRTYRLRGLEKEANYKIWFEDFNNPVVKTGLELMQNGVEFNLPSIESSDILHIEKVAGRAATPDRPLIANITEVNSNGQHKGAIMTTPEGYDRFDIRFNMSLRDTVLGVRDGKVEEDVVDDYKDVISIDGKKVSELLAEDAEAVKMDYDVNNNILNVYVKSGIIDKTKGVEVEIDETLESDGHGILEGAVTFAYSPTGRDWTKAVEGLMVESITVTGNAAMKVGESQTLTVAVSPEGAENKSVTWTSSNSKVATVAADGKVTAIGEGNVRITATAKDGSDVFGYIDITVSKSGSQQPTPSNPGNPGNPNNPNNPSNPNATGNKYKPYDPNHPGTGDETNFVLWIVLAAVAIAGAAVALVFIRKRRHS